MGAGVKVGGTDGSFSFRTCTHFAEQNSTNVNLCGGERVWCMFREIIEKRNKQMRNSTIISVLMSKIVYSA